MVIFQSILLLLQTPLKEGGGEGGGERSSSSSSPSAASSPPLLFSTVDPGEEEEELRRNHPLPLSSTFLTPQAGRGGERGEEKMGLRKGFDKECQFAVGAVPDKQLID